MIRKMARKERQIRLEKVRKTLELKDIQKDRKKIKVERQIEIEIDRQKGWLNHQY